MIIITNIDNNFILSLWLNKTHSSGINIRFRRPRYRFTWRHWRGRRFANLAPLARTRRMPKDMLLKLMTGRVGATARCGKVDEKTDSRCQKMGGETSLNGGLPRDTDALKTQLLPVIPSHVCQNSLSVVGVRTVLNIYFLNATGGSTRKGTWRSRLGMY